MRFGLLDQIFKHLLTGLIVLPLELIFHIHPQLIILQQAHSLLKCQLSLSNNIHVVGSLPGFD